MNDGPDEIEVQDVVYRREWDQVAGKYKDIIQKGVARRKRDARIWGNMSARQERAAEWIVSARDMKLAGLMGHRIGNYGQIHSGGHHDPEEYAKRYRELQDAYTEWRTECFRQRICVDVVVNILCGGSSLGSQERGRRNGWARVNLNEALDLFADLKKWR